MRLPLLVAARPKFSRGSNGVPLPEGRWHVVAERLKDSVLCLSVNNEPLPSCLAAQRNGHLIVGPCALSLTFVNRGSEDYIHVFAERAR